MIQGKGLFGYFISQKEVNNFLSMIEGYQNVEKYKERLTQFSKQPIKIRMKMQGLLKETIESMLSNVNDVGDLETILSIMVHCKEMGYNVHYFENAYEELEDEPLLTEKDK